MELMSERVAKGLDVKPAKRMRRKPGKSTSQISLLSSAGDSTLSLLPDDDETETETGSSKSKDWVRAAVNVASTGKTWVDDGRRLVKGMQVSCRSDRGGQDVDMARRGYRPVTGHRAAPQRLRSCLSHQMCQKLTAIVRLLPLYFFPHANRPPAQPSSRSTLKAPG